jgi:prophage regulatory protein
MDDTQDRIVSSEERRNLVPYSDMQIWRLEQAGEFPKRIRLGPNRVGWSLLELQDWIAARKSERSENEQS